MNLSHTKEGANSFGQTDLEEIWNGSSHMFAALLSILGISYLFYSQTDQIDSVKGWSYGIYGFTVISLFSISAAYHFLPDKRLKLIFKKLDHCAIYLMLAGTYTPYMFLTLGSSKAVTIAYIVWAVSILGIFLKIIALNKFKLLAVGLQLALGWASVSVISELYEKFGALGMAWFVSGGLCYTVGVFFYLRKSMPYSHAIWHLFVLAGTICHYVPILLFT